jgi:hypothetical protein
MCRRAALRLCTCFCDFVARTPWCHKHNSPSSFFFNMRQRIYKKNENKYQNDDESLKRVNPSWSLLYLPTPPLLSRKPYDYQ